MLKNTLKQVYKLRFSAENSLIFFLFFTIKSKFSMFSTKLSTCKYEILYIINVDNYAEKMYGGE